VDDKAMQIVKFSTGLKMDKSANNELEKLF
jgi:hypothetical protein